MKRSKKSCISALLLAILLILSACSKPAPSSATPEISTWQEQYDLGMRYLSEGNYEEAIIAFTAAIEIDPKQAPAYVGRGDAYIGSGETEETLALAQADYEIALEFDNQLVEVYKKLAEVYVSRGEFERAKAVLSIGYELTQSEVLAEHQRKMEISQVTERQLLDGFPKEERIDMPDGSGRYTITEYNKYGDKIKLVNYSAIGEITATYHWEYDEQGTVLQKDIYYPQAEADEQRTVSIHEHYDKEERIVFSVINISNGDSTTATYTYQEDGASVQVYIQLKYSIYTHDAGFSYVMKSTNNYIQIGSLSSQPNGIDSCTIFEFIRLPREQNYLHNNIISETEILLNER
jgi:Tfp pilus assembly protein PilF